MKETDTGVPYRHGPYFYYSRSVKGKPYKIHCRSSELEGEEQVTKKTCFSRGCFYSVYAISIEHPLHLQVMPTFSSPK